MYHPTIRHHNHAHKWQHCSLHPCLQAQECPHHLWYRNCPSASIMPSTMSPNVKPLCCQWILLPCPGVSNHSKGTNTIDPFTNPNFPMTIGRASHFVCTICMEKKEPNCNQAAMGSNLINYTEDVRTNTATLLLSTYSSTVSFLSQGTIHEHQPHKLLHHVTSQMISVHQIQTQWHPEWNHTGI